MVEDDTSWAGLGCAGVLDLESGYCVLFSSAELASVHGFTLGHIARGSWVVVCSTGGNLAAVVTN